MKKIFILLLGLIILSGCSNTAVNEVSSDDRYNDMIELVETNKNYLATAEYYDITFDIASIGGGYRYYIFIDNPRIALYNISVIALEDGVDYKTSMAPSVGVFEGKTYNMIPNQTNSDKGYVKGVVLSGTTTNENPHIKLLVQYQDKMLTSTYRDYYEFDIVVSEVNANEQE